MSATLVESRPIAPRNVVEQISATIPRHVWLASAQGPLTCGKGHRLRDPLVWDHGCLRCTQGAPNEGRGHCDSLVYLIGGGLVTPKGEPLYLLTEVTLAEMRHMKDRRLDWAGCIEYLGLRLFP